ncbi:hypothetical protein BGZ60DRAFT_399707 [Tricladium varicosporioides]|nr:hypothetical protein BGZ60DRAFT_399707 [Hymenoscyphus varicosporioides]
MFDAIALHHVMNAVVAGLFYDLVVAFVFRLLASTRATARALVGVLLVWHISVNVNFCQGFLDSDSEDCQSLRIWSGGVKCGDGHG